MDAVQFEGDAAISYHFYDWGEWGQMAYRLAAKILEKEQKFDRLVALATGGLTLSRAMRDYLNIPKLSSLSISFYTGIGQAGRTPVIRESLATDVEGERILIFDDINDSGSSLQAARKYLELRGAASITTATILQKPVTACPSDYYVDETSDWIIFPDEVRETIVALTQSWREKGVSAAEIDVRLLKIGFRDFHLDLIKAHP